MREIHTSNEPIENLSDLDVGRAMSEALAEYRIHALSKKPIPMHIAGDEVTSDMTHAVYDPARIGRCIGKVYTARRTHVTDACSEAKKTFNRSGAYTFYRELNSRIQTIKRAADIIRRKKFAIAAQIVYEAGKSQASALAEVDEALDFLSLYGKSAPAVFDPTRYQPNIHAEENTAMYCPRGVTAAISAWNFPFSLMLEKVAASYLSGCPAVMKPAEQTPLSAHMVYRIMMEAGVDPGMLHYLSGDGSVGGMLVASPHISQICFTGSESVGAHIESVTAGSFKKLDLEMGGNNPMIITPFYDMTESISGAVASKFSQAGQKCASLQRLYVVDDSSDGAFYQTFRTRFIEAVRSLEWGHPADPKKRYAYNALIDEEAVQKIRLQIEDAKQFTEPICEVLLSDLAREGNFVGPVIFEGIPEEADAVAKEIFGPVLFLYRVRSLEEAMERASMHHHITTGLYSTLPSDQDAFVQYMAQNGSGNIYLNRPIIGSMPGRQPFGGRGRSGTGKIGYPERLLFFVDMVSVAKNRIHQGVLF